ncbi:MAG: DUF2283 domain-containing protein [Pseudomonadota bacterium]
MKLNTDPEGDAPYLTLQVTEVTTSPEESPGIVVDNSVDYKIMGIAGPAAMGLNHRTTRCETTKWNNRVG